MTELPQVKVIGTKEQIKGIRDALEIDFEIISSSAQMENREDLTTFHQYLVLSRRDATGS